MPRARAVKKVSVKILKFGGSSLATPERIRTVVEIIRRGGNGGQMAVVVSAMGGVTDTLVDASRRAAARDPQWEALCGGLEDRHLDAARAAASPEERAALEDGVRQRVGELRELLHGMFLVRECTARTQDQVLSYGERLSAALVAAALRHQGVSAQDCDARNLVVTDQSFGAARVDTEATYARLRDHFGQKHPLQVLTGFIGATADGETTTLGRGGSDLTAALLGVALDAEAIEIWTDVDGVMSADPRLVPGAFSLSCLSYEELMELSHFGAKVVYPPTVHPARSQGIPLVIRNTLNPDFPGTRIVQHTEPSPYPIRGISSINRVALCRLQGDGMVGVPGTAKRLFEALAREQISVILISQASSEHSICFAIQPAVVGRARASIDAEFALERKAGLIDDLVVEDDLSVIAAVGEAMRERPGIAGMIFSVLGHRGINVRAIAQGSSELNISLAIGRHDEARALNAIHDAFFAPGVQVFLVGTGRVGKALREQLQARSEILARSQGLSLRIAGLANSTHMVLDRGGVGSGEISSLDTSEPMDAEKLARFVEETAGTRLFVDCTASASVPHLYRRLLRSGTAVVTANKLALTGPLSDYRKLMSSRWAHGRGFYYETTVGAGLPVIRTLRDLVETGDSLQRVEGIFSGTLSFLCHRLAEGCLFSEALREAHRAGYTEPDPREDLSGNDVARKLLILAREAGSQLEQQDVEVEPLIPVDEQLAGASLDEFWSQVARFDAALGERQRIARERGEVLCYLARLQDGRARVGLTSVGPTHPCANISGTDNLFAFYTQRYASRPLAVQGPGAGPEVTAAGVFADILRAVAESSGIVSR